MKNKVRNIAFIVSFILIVGILFLSSSGKLAGVMILDYETSEDGNLMDVKVGLLNSIGFIRTFREKDLDNKKYITFYSTYGFNNSIGAKQYFQFQLKPDCDEIYFYSGNNEYKMKLQRDPKTKEWYEVNGEDLEEQLN